MYSAATGGAIDADWWKAEFGIPEEFVQGVAGMVREGDSAIFALLRSADPNYVAEQFRGYGGTILRTMLTERAVQEGTVRSAGQRSPVRESELALRLRWRCRDQGGAITAQAWRKPRRMDFGWSHRPRTSTQLGTRSCSKPNVKQGEDMSTDVKVAKHVVYDTLQSQINTVGREAGHTESAG